MQDYFPSAFDFGFTGYVHRTANWRVHAHSAGDHPSRNLVIGGKRSSGANLFGMRNI